jgi:hypothetical protein
VPLSIARLLLCALCLACLGSPAHSEQRAFIWGVNGHPLTAYPGVDYDKQLDLVQDLGLTSYRVNVSEPRHILQLVELVNKAKARNIEILPVLTPGVDMDDMAPKDLRREAYSFALAVVSPLKGKVKVWELGNEMDIFALLQPCEIDDAGNKRDCSAGIASGEDDLDYQGARWKKVSAVLRGLSEGVKKADPAALRAMGVSGWGRTPPFRMLRRDGVDWDISVWHMYGQDPEEDFKALAELGKPIWVTEFANPYDESRSEQAEAGALRGWMARLLELGPIYRVEAAHIYELLDETYWEPSDEARRGLTKLEKDGEAGWKVGKPKPAYGAVKSFIQGRQADATPAR